jgi:hypothetical protein
MALYEVFERKGQSFYRINCQLWFLAEQAYGYF